MMNSNSTVYTAADQSDNSVAADGAEGKEKEEEEVSFSHRYRWIGRLGERIESYISGHPRGGACLHILLTLSSISVRNRKDDLIAFFETLFFDKLNPTCREDWFGVGIIFSLGTSETPSTTVVVENIHFFREFSFWDSETREAIHRNYHSIFNVSLR
uniref:Uncharacterized protein n=1 Tax=Salix viminalis TaxID=40686 RepID=A0A6N2M8J1_SALVM